MNFCQHKPPQGYENRALLMRAYPTQEQVEKAESLQPSLAEAWNWLTWRQREALEAHEAKAVKDGLVCARLPRPEYKGLSPEQRKAVKLKWRKECAERSINLRNLDLQVSWRPCLSGTGSEAERLGLKQDYEVVNWHLRCVFMPPLPVTMAQSLIRNHAKVSGKKKKYRKHSDILPLQVTSGEKLRLRRAPSRCASETWDCNVEVHLPRIGWIACYADSGLLNQLLTPGNTTREGCTLRYEAGRWYASVKIIRRVSTHPCPADGSMVGIDPGLANLATTSDGDVLRNHRNVEYADARATAQSICSMMPAGDLRDSLYQEIWRTDARQRRRARTQVRQFAAYISTNYQYVAIENNTGVALGIGSKYKGSTKELLHALQARCGPDRLITISAAYNSQTCCRCLRIDREAWERKSGKSQICECLYCGYCADRDLNAALNIKQKAIALQAFIL